MKSGFNIILFVVISFLLLFASGNLLAQAAYDTVSIYDLQYVPDPAVNDTSPYTGDTVVVKGMVMNGPRDLWLANRYGAFIVDPDSFPKPWSGFFIIQNDTESVEAHQTQFEFAQPGYIGYFTGVVDQYQEFTEVALLTNGGVSANFISLNNPLPDPKVLTAADLTQSLGEQWEGMYVEIQDAHIVSQAAGSTDWASFTDATDTLAYLEEYFNWFRDRLPIQGDGSYNWPAPGTQINVRGFLHDISGSSAGQVFALDPRDTSDIEILGNPPPVISTTVTRDPGVPTSSDGVVVSTVITDNELVDSASVIYSVNDGPFQSANMGHVNNNYFATIPAQSDGDFVRYFIYAEDNTGGSITQPGDTSRASGRVYFYTVRDGGLSIADVQNTHGYALDRSGYENYEVTLQGVINTDSSDFPLIYFIQDAAAMWSGIEVYGPSLTNSYDKGDEVAFTGTVRENFGFTRLVATSSSLVTAGVGAYDPIDVTTGEIATGGANAEAYEGVLIRVQNLTVINPFPDSPGNYGEFTVSDGTGELRVDDTDLSGRPAFPGNLDSAYAAGDHIDAIIAELVYSFGDYKIWPRDTNDVIGLTGIKDNDLAVPSNFALNQNYPNPFNPTTEIEYSIAASGIYSINIYNILGQKVRTLVNKNHSVGNYKLQWDGTDNNHQQVGSGIYFYSLKGDRVSLTKKMILLK